MWISKREYEAQVEKIRALEEERKTLLDRIATLSGQAPIYTQPPAPVPPAAPEQTAATEKKEDPQRHTLRFDDIRLAARNAAAKGQIGAYKVK